MTILGYVHHLGERLKLSHLRQHGTVEIVKRDDTASVSGLCVVTHPFTFVRTFGWIVIEPIVIAESVQQKWGHL